MTRYLNICLSAVCIILWVVEAPDRNHRDIDVLSGQVEAVVPVVVLVDTPPLGEDSNRVAQYRVCGYAPVVIERCDSLVSFGPVESGNRSGKPESKSLEPSGSAGAGFRVPILPRIRLPKIGEVLSLPF